MKKLFLIILGLLVMFSCDSDSTLPNGPDMTLMSMEQNTINPGELPWPMIVGGEEVDPACPNCKYPLSLSVSEFNFESSTLHHKIRCPARWKKGEMVLIDGETRFMAELNSKNKPIILRCNWTGHLIEGRVHGSLDTTKTIYETRSGEE